MYPYAFFDYSKNIHITSTCIYNGIDNFHYLIRRDLSDVSDLFNCKLMKTNRNEGELTLQFTLQMLTICTIV